MPHDGNKPSRSNISTATGMLPSHMTRVAAWRRSIAEANLDLNYVNGEKGELAMRARYRLLTMLAGVTAISFLETRAEACWSGYSCGICSEAVTNYANQPGFGNLPNSLTNNRNMITALQNNGGGPYPAFYVGVQYEDSSVWDTDFRDPDLFFDPYASVDSDTYNFDKYGCAVSYFKGHGWNAADTEQQCTTGSQCNNPPTTPVAGFGQGSCSSYFRLNGTVDSRCIYDYTQMSVVINNNSSWNSSHSVRGGVLRYSDNFEWGESPTSGGWDQVGTNGGTNFVILDKSYGVRPGFIFPELIYMFAGVHVVATVMPTAGDTNDSANRGATWAGQFATNAYGSPSNAWLNVVSMMGSDGSQCGNGSQGGWGGFNGCGCNTATSIDSTYAKSQNHVSNENWGAMQWDGNDALGNGNQAAMFTLYQCSYNTVQAPITK